MENTPVKILVIDDTQENLTLLKALLKVSFPQGQIFTSQNGKAGIEIALNESPDIILLDIFMPVFHGLDVCRKIKKNPRISHIPVIVLTAQQDDHKLKTEALEAGAQAFLTKPFEINELKTQINAILIHQHNA